MGTDGTERRKMNRLLIVKPSSLGDILHAFPAAAVLCRETGAAADWLVHPAFAPLLHYLPCVKRGILFERRRLGSLRTFLPAWFSLRRELKREKYDAVIDFQGLLRSALLGRTARAEICAGMPHEWIARPFYGRKLSADPHLHALLRNNAAAADFLGKPADEIDFSFRLEPVEEYVRSARTLLGKNGVPSDRRNMLIGIAPGARWPTKQWPPAFFARLIGEIGKIFPEALFLLFGSQADAEGAETIRKSVPDPERVVGFCGQTELGDLVELTRLCSLFISNDSGPMHIAAALDIPVLAFFGATSPVLTGPYTRRKAILRPGLPCEQCFRHRCADMKCHGAVRPEDAAAAAARLLERE